MVKCPAIFIANGRVSPKAVVFNTVVQITCVPGFKLNGGRKLRCGADGSWMPNVPTCEPGMWSSGARLISPIYIGTHVYWLQISLGQPNWCLHCLSKVWHNVQILLWITIGTSKSGIQLITIYCQNINVTLLFVLKILHVQQWRLSRFLGDISPQASGTCPLCWTSGLPHFFLSLFEPVVLGLKSSVLAITSIVLFLAEAVSFFCQYWP